MKLKNCPICGSGLADRWVVGRKLQQYCGNSHDTDCTWKGDPRTPERKRITNLIDLRIDGFYGWAYHTYDQYGHVSCYSRTFVSEATAMTDLEERLKRSPEDTGVLFFTPATVKLKGKMFKLNKGVVKRTK